MTKDDITRMARAAGFVGFDGENKCLRQFADLIAAAERDSCCDLLEGMHVAGTGSHNYYLHAAKELRRLRNARSTT